MAFIGDTVRLVVKFRTFNGNPVEVTNVTLRILDGDTYEVIENITITDDNRTDVGVYEHDYIVPEGTTKTLIYEYSGIYNDKPILSRGSFERVFIN
ncbi:hypothetical protein MTP04_34450 [Lysinibacillus sp. PLM2]|nr:hypothetical protein MTP04_34450 [Lysinibacillus sp. PLM2]